MKITTAILFLTIFTLSLYSEPMEIPLSVEEPKGVDRYMEPVSSGIPLAKGKIKNVSELGLFDKTGQNIPAQFDVLTKWPDQTIKWVLITFFTDLKAKEKKEFILKQISSPLPRVPNSIKISKSQANIEVATGPIKFSVNTTKFNLFDNVFIDLNKNSAFEPEENILNKNKENGFFMSCLNIDKIEEKSTAQQPGGIAIEKEGPLMAVLYISGCFPDISVNETFPEPTDLVKYHCRIYAYAGKDYVRVSFTLENTGAYGQHTEFERLFFKNLYGKLHIKSTEKETVACQNFQEPGNGQAIQLIQNVHETNGFQYRILKDTTEVISGERALGWLDVNEGDFGVTVSMQRFWQNYPKSLGVKNGTILMGLWPDDFQYPEKFLKQNGVRDKDGGIYIGKTPGKPGFYMLCGARQKTNEMLLRFYAGARDKNTAVNLNHFLNYPLMARADSKWYSETNAFFIIPQEKISTTDEYLKQKAPEYNRRLRARVVGGEDTPGTIKHYRKTGANGGYMYGWVNFGDLSWALGPSMLHYDWTGQMMLNFMRLGNYEFFETGHEMAYHSSDIDHLHSNRDNIYSYLTHWESGILNTHDGIIPNSSHHWIQGLCMYYCLTGDRNILKTILEAGKNTLTDGGELRGPGWQIENHLSIYEVTGDEQYLNNAKNIFEKNIWARGNNDKWKNNSVNFFFKAPLQGGYIQGPLIKYHFITGDNRALDILKNQADWFMSNCINDKGGINMTLLKKIMPAEYIDNFHPILHVDGAAYVYSQTGDEKYLNYSRKLFQATFGHTAVGFGGGNTSTKIDGWTARNFLVYMHIEDLLARGELGKK